MILKRMVDEIEIDLRKYIQVLARHWWQILLFSAIFAMMGFAITSLITKVSYSATTLVAITKPKYQLSFNSEFQTLNIQPANNAFLDLATSDDVLKQVYDQWVTRPSSIKNLESFRQNNLKVSTGTDSSILKLNVITDSPSDSSQLANLWAMALVDKATEVYNDQNQQLSFLEDQQNQAKLNLDQAEKNLIDFQSQSQLQIFTNELTSTLQLQEDYLTIQRNNIYINQSLQGLHSQVASNSGDQGTIADQLSTLMLQLQTYNSLPQGNNSTIPLQVQFTDPNTFGNLNKQGQLAVLDDIEVSIQDRLTKVANDLQTLTPQILELQQSVQQLQAEQDQLINARDIAKQTYTTLSQTVDQTRISSQEPTGVLQLASSASIPSEPLPRNRFRNAILAGFVGGVLMIFIVLIIYWWQGMVPEEEQ
jgi:uncharacterized protein involved in exopolysaccharide biosynthesis